jgi:hypothetical protein
MSKSRRLRRRCGPEWWDTGEDCIMRNFITCMLQKILLE